MIRITIELFPFGFEEAKKTLGIMDIWNNASGNNSSGNYGFRIFKKNSKAVWKSGDINGFPRKQLLAWDLLYRCLKEVLDDRNEN